MHVKDMMKVESELEKLDPYFDALDAAIDAIKMPVTEQQRAQFILAYVREHLKQE